MGLNKDQYRIAQYSQWNGRPDVQGVTILSFVREVLNSPKLGTALYKNNNNLLCRPIDARAAPRVTVEETKLWCEAGCPSADLKPYPLTSRKTGATVLDLVADATELGHVIKQIGYLSDSIFYECADVLDLD
ncbi:hypothetical protein BKA67DRAFT_691276 [Truncatella angustata]|uniref:Uncharacterized protein n=1 Tax=Truncatella angustata TaxID=152316 RepID=A0A9P8UL81_9PEZI|nr:uncharacterized protein BKA67DRAFT_691276 [Truncatella angustata]KAH6654221.1 hypothetical protein BKA67DRAFT_691276 [Truncatella angustata]